MLIQERNLKTEEKDIKEFLDRTFSFENDKYQINGEQLSLQDVLKYLDLSDPISVSTNSKQIQFDKVILNWWFHGKKPDEDTDYIFRTLKRFMGAQAKNIKLPKKAIEYDTPGEMDKDLDKVLPRDETELAKNYPGDVVKIDGDYVLRKISTWEEAQQCFKDSGWCVQNKNMFDSYKPPYFMITHKEPNGTEKRVALAHKDSEQLKDVKDDPLPYSIGKEFLPLIDYIFNLQKTVFYNSADDDRDENINDLYPYYKNRVNINSKLSNNQLAELAQDPKMAYDYANDVIENRFPAAEHIMSSHPNIAYKYALNVIKGRWPAGEASIAKVPYIANQYARNVIKGRFPEGEAAISKDSPSAFSYARDVIQDRFPEGEAAIATNARDAYEYVEKILDRKRWPEGESIISQNPEFAYKYARVVIKGRFPAGEPTILKNPNWANWYDINILGGKWKKEGILTESQEITALRNDLKKIFI